MLGSLWNEGKIPHVAGTHDVTVYPGTVVTRDAEGNTYAAKLQARVTVHETLRFGYLATKYVEGFWDELKEALTPSQLEYDLEYPELMESTWEPIDNASQLAVSLKFGDLSLGPLVVEVYDFYLTGVGRPTGTRRARIRFGFGGA
jgi:aryl-alcohol dehydrogenase-like predicted oxidoreductase